MKKMRIALASMLVAAGITATAGAANFTNCADRLKDVGLFQGTNQGYQLDKAPTRAEASAMLVRLLGKEAEAEKLTYTAPFTDLKGWEKPYVQYLYDNGLANGMSATAYNPTGKCSAQMYTTFLRALGYSMPRAILPMPKHWISESRLVWLTMSIAAPRISCVTT
ncbi:MAG: S-layer homology domain-containing protein [Butyricicoccus sp.]